MRSEIRLAIALFVVCGGWITAVAETPEKKPSSLSAALWRLPQSAIKRDDCWCDEFIYGDWRIERDVLENRCRLRDDKGLTRCSDTYEKCLGVFRNLQDEEKIPLPKEEVVILLHGLARSRDSMEPLRPRLAKAGFGVLLFGYPSAHGKVADHAHALARVIEQLDGVKKFHFVGHSLGNIVVRHWMADQLSEKHQLDPRVGRMVMLGPPNQGASLAEQMKANPVLHLVFGKSGRQLSEEWNTLEDKLCIPPCEFGILAGNQGVNPLVEGENDLCVAVEETKLSGASDFRVLPLNHSTLRTDPLAQRMVLRFLKQGFFESPEKRQRLDEKSK